MPVENRHSKDSITDLVDNRLPPEARAELERHLAVCAECSRELESLKWTKTIVRAKLEDVALPADLAERCVNALQREEALAGLSVRRPFIPFRRRALRWAFALAAAAAVVLVVGYFQGERAELPGEMARTFASYRSGQLPLETHTTEATALEKFFRERRVPFGARVFDLAMMGLRLEGGRVHRVSDRESALFVYRRTGDENVLCQMFRGTESELPQAAAVRVHNGIRFHIYRRGEITVVFWPEGELLCALTSDGNAEELIQLAFAKAMKI